MQEGSRTVAPPQRRATLGQRAFWWFLLRVITFTLVPLLRMSATGWRHLPRKEPYLFLSNHVTWVDPFAIGYYCNRRIHYLASAHWYARPLVGFFLKLFGTIPKMKFTSDRSAMVAMEEWYRSGEVIGLFPEGRRTWDGRTLKVLPHIGRLVKRLDAPVVFCRILTGYYHQPRWAVYPRWAPFRMEYEGPIRYPAQATEEQIEADIQRRITVDTDRVPVPRWVLGWRLAWGLPNLLWACPHCFAQEGLRVDPADGDVVRCRACGAAWRVDVASRLHPVAAPADEITVAEAHGRLQARFGDPPRAPPPGAEADVLLQDPCTVASIGADGTRSVVAMGMLVLTPDVLRVRGQEGGIAWQTPLATLGAVSVEGGATLQIRPPGALLRLEFDGASVVKWRQFIGRWRDLARADPAAPTADGVGAPPGGGP